MRRILAVGLVLVCLTACGASEPENVDVAPEAAPVTENSVQEQTEEVVTAETHEVAMATDEATTDVSAENDNSGKVQEIIEKMTLEEKIGQMMVPSFRKMGNAGATENVTELNDKISDLMRTAHFGGTVLFAENCKNAEQTLKLVASMQAISTEDGGIPLLVAIDQEGGYVTRLSYGTTGPGNMALAATGDTNNARTMAGIYGKELGLLGINTDFAPVVDVNNNPDNPVIGIRSFSDKPAVVSEFACAYIDGLHSEGIISSMKHFPGHGNTDVDSHTGLPLVSSTYEELKANELIPFKAGIDAGADMIMTAHIQFPNIEKTTYISKSTGEQIYIPATMSPVILTDILRKDMGFEGVIVSDALDMAAITDNFLTEDVLKMTINAGVDMLLLPAVQDDVAFNEIQTTLDTAIKLVKDNVISEQRIDEAVTRILTLKEKYGLLPGYELVADDEKITAAINGVGSESNRKVAGEIAQKAVTAYKNENEALPISLEDGGKILIILSEWSADRIGLAELAKEQLDGADITIMANKPDNATECINAAKAADHVILVHRMYGGECIDPAKEESYSAGVFDRIIQAVHEEGKKVTVISCQLPYDAARFAEADAVLLVYGAKVMKSIPPTSGEGSSIMPNLTTGILACFGEGELSGSSPVTIPEQ